LACDVGYWHLADIPAVPAFVRYWTKADNGGFLPAMVCPLMTQSGHSDLIGFEAICVPLAFSSTDTGCLNGVSGTKGPRQDLVQMNIQKNGESNVLEEDAAGYCSGCCRCWCVCAD
jgi:hypothetical protein